MKKSIVLIILSLIFMSTTIAQSVNQKSPTPLTEAEFTGEGPSTETNYYYSFIGGPGEVSVTLRIKATDYSTFARLEVLTTGFNALAMHNMNATTGTGPQEVTKKVVLKKQQTVILKLTLDGHLNEYKIILDGAVQTNKPSEDNIPQASQNSSNSGGQVQESVSQSQGNTPTQNSGKDKIFLIDFNKYKLGKLINLPKIGLLNIQMSDGTTQTIDLKKVKSFMVSKQ